MSDQSSCSDYLGARASDQDQIVAQLAKDLASEAATTTAGHANLLYLCTESSTTRLYDAVSQTGERAGQLDGRVFDHVLTQKASAATRAAMVAAAVEGVAASFDFDYRHAQASVRRAERAYTPRLLNMIGPILARKAVKGTQRVVTTRVLAAGLAGVGTDKAQVLVLAETRSADQEPEPSHRALAVIVTVERVGNGWLVDDLVLDAEIEVAEPDKDRVAAMRAAEEFYDTSGNEAGETRVNRSWVIGVVSLGARRASVVLLGRYLTEQDATPLHEGMILDLEREQDVWKIIDSERLPVKRPE